MAMTDIPTIRDLQVNLPWSIRYSADFRANPQPHKDFAHALVHIAKAAGRLSEFVDDMDHRKETADDPSKRDEYAKYIADMVVCALRMANTFPGGPVDLATAVVDRLQSKNGVTLTWEPATLQPTDRGEAMRILAAGDARCIAADLNLIYGVTTGATTGSLPPNVSRAVARGLVSVRPILDAGHLKGWRWHPSAYGKLVLDEIAKLKAAS